MLAFKVLNIFINVKSISMNSRILSLVTRVDLTMCGVRGVIVIFYCDWSYNGVSFTLMTSML
jgi:hypothetical protein